MDTRMVCLVRGIVQGVGFRPFVLRCARELGLAGTVANTAEGVRLVCEGPRRDCEALLRRVREAPPPGALVFSVAVREEEPLGERGFRILASLSGVAQAAVSPDIGICEDCIRELLDPNDRRYGYPFLNCTRCGPRFTILRQVPYDRVNTSMADFLMCEACAGEYKDTENRRFHAQPTACASCGPRLIWMENGQELPGDAVMRFADAISAGKIVAVRGLGGYHLACDARNEAAVLRVRQKKHRDAKPFAVMVRDMEEAERLCCLEQKEREALLSPRKPIVLLQRREGCDCAQSVAPDGGRLGLMLPYTPLHVLLLQNAPALVMTSANVSDAPMPYQDTDLERVAELCDAVLSHDRPILRRMDDSVCVLAAGRMRLLRRARGYVPQPLLLAGAGEHILAFGAQQKNTFCLVKDERAYLSGHMGDLDDADAYAGYLQEMRSFLDLFGAAPAVLVCDKHPDYASTRALEAVAERFPAARRYAVQHHHAHFASVLAEHGIERAQGYIWDGSGYGSKGGIWGGEQLLGGVAEVTGVGALCPLRLPGGDAAVREPWRTALSAVAEACGREEALRLFGHHDGADLLLDVSQKDALSPLSRGMGRLFDAVAAIAGLNETAAYEGQAAMALENAFDETAQGAYRFAIGTDPDGFVWWDWRPVIRGVLADRQRGAGVISARFHRALADLVEQTLVPGEAVALTGGVFQNVRLLTLCAARLKARGVAVYTNESVPCNDGGISYGQAAVAAALRKGEKRNVSGGAGCGAIH